jgi:hypothetical protein
MNCGRGLQAGIRVERVARLPVLPEILKREKPWKLTIVKATRRRRATMSHALVVRRPASAEKDAWMDVGFIRLDTFGFIRLDT